MLNVHTEKYFGQQLRLSTEPSSQAVATIRVVNETFRVLLTTEDQVKAARAAQAGGSANIPMGRIIAGTQVNVGYTWHLEDVGFFEATIELCDGLPSMVEEAGGRWGNGYFCPCGARVIAVE